MLPACEPIEWPAKTSTGPIDFCDRVERLPVRAPAGEHQIATIARVGKINCVADKTSDRQRFANAKERFFRRSDAMREQRDGMRAETLRDKFEGGGLSGEHYGLNVDARFNAVRKCDADQNASDCCGKKASIGALRHANSIPVFPIIVRAGQKFQPRASAQRRVR